MTPSRSFRPRIIGARSLIWLLALAAVPLLSGCGWWTRVDPGYTGALLTYNTSSTGKAQIAPVTPGHWVFVDWVTQKMTKMPVGQQTLTMVRTMREGKVQGDDSVSCQDANLVGVHMDVSVMWRVDSAHVGDLYLLKPTTDIDAIEDQIVRRDARSIVPIACGGYTYDEIKALKRAEVGHKVEELLKPVLAQSYLVLDQVAIGETYIDNPDVQKAIDAKAKAQIDAQAAQALLQKTQNEQAAKLAEAEAQQRIRQIESQTEADANARVNASLTPLLVQEDAIKKWDGKLPQVSGGDTLIETTLAAKQ